MKSAPDLLWRDLGNEKHKVSLTLTFLDKSSMSDSLARPRRSFQIPKNSKSFKTKGLVTSILPEGRVRWNLVSRGPRSCKI